MDAIEAQEQDVYQVLAQYGLVPDLVHVPARIFASPLIDAAAQIRALYPYSSYTHVPEIPDYDRGTPFVYTEQFRRGYAAFKHVVAKVLQPKSIVEIGVGTGVSALAFLAGSPDAHYLGIDNGSKNDEAGGQIMQHVLDRLAAHRYNYRIQIADSMALTEAPKADLFHVDGAHDTQHAFNDTKLAFLSRSEWILIDDARDPIVAGAAMLAAQMSESMFHWASFEDTWTGNILIHRIEP
jgi:predicted O-methyltransferase YrrM